MKTKILGLNTLLFSYEELITILSNKNNPLYQLLISWFGEDWDWYKDCEYHTLVYSEDGAEVNKNDYWLVNIKTDYACTLSDLNDLKERVKELAEAESEE